MTRNTAGMPAYRSFKVLRAIKILMLDSTPDGGADITPSEDGVQPFHVSAEYVTKHTPHVSGYFVVYADGYESFSPAQAFESGYALANYANPSELVRIARVCHEVNAAYCAALGDHSQVAWNDAPQWQRDSAISGVAFHRTNPDAGPDHSHNEWLKEKTATGWKYGAVKDSMAKEHPCFVPYDQLPPEQKAKDFIFRAVVHALK